MQLVSSLFLEGSSTLYLNVTVLRSLQGKAISGYPWCGHESVLWPKKYLEPADSSKSSPCLFSIFAPSPLHAPHRLQYSGPFPPSPQGGALGFPQSQWRAPVCRERGRKKLDAYMLLGSSFSKSQIRHLPVLKTLLISKIQEGSLLEFKINPCPTPSLAPVFVMPTACISSKAP